MCMKRTIAAKTLRKKNNSKVSLLMNRPTVGGREVRTEPLTAPGVSEAGRVGTNTAEREKGPEA